MKKQRLISAFSLIELSIVLIIIAILIVSVIEGANLVNMGKLSGARSKTNASAVLGVENIVAWYEVTLTKSFNDNLVDGNPVTTWYDISPQNSAKYNFIQNTAANKPTYLKSGINGLPVLSFDGTNDFFNSTNNFNALLNYTIFIVEARTSATSGPMLGATNGVTLGYDTTNTKIRIHHVGNGITDWTPYTISAYGSTTPRILSFTSAISTSTQGLTTLYVNGAIQSGSALRFLPGSGPYTIGFGLGSYYKGYIGEIIIFDRALEITERKNIENYLMKKWGIAVS